MMYEYSELFENISDGVCENCQASTGECECLDSRSCPFWSEFEDIAELCCKLDTMVEDLTAASGVTRSELERLAEMDRT